MLRSRVIFIPANQCSWAVVPSTERQRRTREEIGYEFEKNLPKPIEHYAVDYYRQPDGSYVAAAVSIDIVKNAIESHDVVHPAACPSFLSADVPPGIFDFARGLLASRRTRLLGLSVLTVTTSLALIVSSLLTVGLLRRAGLLINEADMLRSLVDDAYSQVLPSDTPAGQPISILVQGLLRQARQASSATKGLSLPDTREDLAVFLAAWPADGARLRQLSVERDSASIEVLLPADRDASSLLASFQQISGWAQSAPSVRRNGADQSVTIRFTRVGEEPSS